MRSYDCVLKTGGENGSPPPQTNAALEGRYGGSIVHFVGFATVALTAELSRLVCADSGRGRVVGCANEEHRRVIAGRQTALRSGRNLHHVHKVLIVAGGAQNDRVAVIGRRTDEEAIVLYELVHLRAGGIGDCTVDDRAVPVVLAAAANRGVQSHRVVIEVVAQAVAVISEQGRNVLRRIGRGNGLIDLVLHHRALGPVAVVAAEAGQDAAHVGCAGVEGSRQRLRIVAAAIVLPGDDGLAEQRSNVLAPEGHVAGGGIGGRNAVAARAAMWSMTGCAATTIVEVSAQHVSGGAPSCLRHCERGERQD